MADIEKDRERVLGRGYQYMTDAEVAKDLVRRYKKNFGDIGKTQDKKKGK